MEIYNVSPSAMLLKKLSVYFLGVSKDEQGFGMLSLWNIVDNDAIIDGIDKFFCSQSHEQKCDVKVLIQKYAKTSWIWHKKE